MVRIPTQRFHNGAERPERSFLVRLVGLGFLLGGAVVVVVAFVDHLLVERHSQFEVLGCFSAGRGGF